MRTSNMKAVQPDQFLAAIVGADPLQRTEITTRLWTYIKANGLQDATNRRQINGDDKLRLIFGRDSIRKWVKLTHDVEEFRAIVQRWGLWQPDLVAFANTMRAVQLELIESGGARG